jgi:tRNA (mo5U34)-methyltransferase
VNLVDALRRVVRRGRWTPPLPLDGWPHGTPIANVDALSDDDLDRLNRMLPWNCFTVDGRGRRLGNRAWTGKREEPQLVPDPRITMMAERFGLAGSTVLEVGCFEGVHTVALCQAGADVVAIDSRIENVVKTVVRAAMYAHRPTVMIRDLDQPDALAGLAVDWVHHVGVLYHLHRPVEHLVDLGRAARLGMMLDTHVADPDLAVERDRHGDLEYRYQPYREHGRDDVFSGMGESARWLPLDDLTAVLHHAGFADVDVVEERRERNGPRVLLFAQR